MELSWTTFILEIINFLVLVWILKHFLYKPVLNVIARRRADIDKRLKDAQEMQSKADALQQKYEGRLSDWEQERKEAREKLRSEIDSERQARLEKLDGEIAQRQQQSEVADARRLADSERKIEAQALLHGARFATRLLEQGAGPETQQRLVAMLTGELSDLSEKSVAAIRRQLAEDTGKISIGSAFPLEEEERSRIEQALQRVFNQADKPEYTVDADLLAGIRITIGAWELDANIRDELQGFVEFATCE